jgi:signal transduction histidine kinase
MNPRVAELAELGVITASLLHELRQALFVVKGRLQLAHDDGAAVDPVSVAELLAAVAHMDELVDHYAGLGRTDDSWTEVDLREAVERAASMLEPRARQIGATLAVELPDGPVYVSGRAVAMRQIAINLARNALDAIDGEARREVALRLSIADRDTVQLIVEDTGHGIPDDIQADLGRRFLTRRKPNGTGLGLYIARTLVTEVKGTLEAARRPAGGTVLTVRLPHAAPPESLARMSV